MPPEPPDCEAGACTWHGAVAHRTTHWALATINAMARYVNVCRIQSIPFSHCIACFTDSCPPCRLRPGAYHSFTAGSYARWPNDLRNGHGHARHTETWHDRFDSGHVL